MTFGAAAPRADGAPAGEVSIGVFSLFHPRELIVRVAGDSALVVHAGESEIVLERSSGTSLARFSLAGGEVLVTAGSHRLEVPRVTVTARGNGPADFELAVPAMSGSPARTPNAELSSRAQREILASPEDQRSAATLERNSPGPAPYARRWRIRRHYRGTLQVFAGASMLTPVVIMDRELAVSSVVAAESSPGSPMEVLKAQAIAARSYLAAAHGRHHDFDFCDTTHCQFLRQPPASTSDAERAVQATRGLVLAYQSHVFAAMYTRSCSGRTHTPSELGLAAGAYPYYPVACSYCRSHPSPWSSRLSARDAATLQPSNEAARLAVVRHLGSAAVPSNDFVAHKESGEVLLEGSGEGHGIGLCQAGAKAMAKAGTGFREILAHYYPNTTLINISPATR